MALSVSNCTLNIKAIDIKINTGEQESIGIKNSSNNAVL